MTQRYRGTHRELQNIMPKAITQLKMGQKDDNKERVFYSKYWLSIPCNASQLALLTIYNHLTMCSEAFLNICVHVGVMSMHAGHAANVCVWKVCTVTFWKKK